MVRSLAVVGVLVAVVVVLTVRSRGSQTHPVEWRPAVSSAASAHRYAVLAPSELPTGWTATSARFRAEPGATDGAMRLHLGFYTSDKQYAGLEQTDLAPALAVPRLVEGGQADGQETLDGQRWTRYQGGKDGTRALVLTRPDSTVAVTGTGSFSELRVLVATLWAPSP